MATTGSSGTRLPDRSLRVPREPVTRADWTSHDYNVHFRVEVDNPSPEPAEVMLGVEGGRWDELPDIRPLIYAAPGPDGPWAPAAAVDGRTDLGRAYALKVGLRPGERLWLANHLPRDGEAVLAECDRLAAAAGAQRVEFGRSAQWRPLVGYVLGDPARQGTLLVTSGFHPPEPDTLGTEALLEWLGTNEGRALTETLAVAVVPVVNPDGFALGTQGANANGVNLHWWFARERPDLAPEAAALWSFAEGLRPRGFIDFHAYTFQARKRPGPYLRPSFFYEGAAQRRAAQRFPAALAAKRAVKPVTSFSAFAPHTLGAMLVERFDTVTAAKYHLHLAEGVEECRRHALDVVAAMSEALCAEGLTSPAPERPISWRKPVRTAWVWWAGLLRPQLGLLRRGRFGALRFDRTGLDAADTTGGIDP